MLIVAVSFPDRLPPVPEFPWSFTNSVSVVDAAGTGPAFLYKTVAVFVPAKTLLISTTVPVRLTELDPELPIVTVFVPLNTVILPSTTDKVTITG